MTRETCSIKQVSRFVEAVTKHHSLLALPVDG